MKPLEFAKKLKEEIIKCSSKQRLDFIVQNLKDKKLSESQIEFLFNYCHSAGYDEKTGNFMLTESDNSEFLKYVNYVFERLRNGKSN
ncbi:hypothetical protein [uncultured Treponema sp.]|uniref:hypothetical protein n=1 Tax=uncultured Treponema sp. TaxID=162155 RepID=UPI0025EAF21D|nr:hypothetical protein [uncultured Treponema sp.]